jgi:hypothetical protein
MFEGTVSLTLLDVEPRGAFRYRLLGPRTLRRWADSATDCLALRRLLFRRLEASVLLKQAFVLCCRPRVKRVLGAKYTS